MTRTTATGVFAAARDPRSTAAKMLAPCRSWQTTTTHWF